MKRIAAWILASILVVAVTSPAAAGQLLANLYQVVTKANCGTIQVVGNLILVDLKVTEACTPSFGPATANTHALCRVDFSPSLVFVTNLVDKAPPPLGHILGREGTFRGLLGSGDEAAYFSILSSNGDCSGAINYSSGFVK